MPPFAPTAINQGKLFGLKAGIAEKGLHLPINRSPSIISSKGGFLAPKANFESVIFGYQIPWLVDFMSDPIHAGSSLENITQKILGSWVRSLASLWGHKTSAFSLRFLWIPEGGQIHIALLCRTTAPKNQIDLQIKNVAQSAETILNSLNIPNVPISSENDLLKYLQPSTECFLQEIRQKETLLPIEVLHGEIQNGYVIYPFTSPTGSWGDITRVIASQQSDILINIHLQPTVLLSEEFGAINSAAQICKELSDFNFSGLSGNIQIKDHNASIAYRLYSTLAQRLEQPFLVVAQVVGNNQGSIHHIANALGNAFISSSANTTEEQEKALRSGYDIYEAGPGLTEQTRSTLTHLWLTDWGHTEALSGMERLRYLADARGAAALFRLPIPSDTGLPGVEVKKLQIGYETGKRITQLPAEHVLLGTQNNNGILSIHKKDLAKHTLICGMPGSGKTNTSLSILDQLWREHKIPFWVLEPPKTEYRGLIKQSGFENILVFTVGDETTAPLRLNPFELLPGIRVEEHINNLKTCFAAGLPKLDDAGSLLPMFLEAPTREIYKQKGWRSSDKHLGAREKREFPTLNDLYNAAQKSLSNYAGDVKQNLTAAVSNRLKSMLCGGKGRMFNTEFSVPIEHLIDRPVIFELLPMGDDAPLALMFLLTFLREHAQRRSDGHLQHITLIEEAHVIMSNAGSTPSSNGAAGVANAFERILAELRSAGEGVIIAEQSPTKLIKGAIDLTNLKIAHRLSGPDEISFVGSSITATAAQKESLQRINTGEAAIFMEGLQGTTFIKVQNFKKDNNYKDRLQDEDVFEHMEQYYNEHKNLKLPFNGCLFCLSQCDFLDDIRITLSDPDLRDGITRAALSLQKTKGSGNADDLQKAEILFASALNKASLDAGIHSNPDGAWCCWVQSVDEDYIFQKHQRKHFDRWIKSLTA